MPSAADEPEPPLDPLSQNQVCPFASQRQTSRLALLPLTRGKLKHEKLLIKTLGKHRTDNSRIHLK
jgi:hypothetical protein